MMPPSSPARFRRGWRFTLPRMRFCGASSARSAFHHANGGFQNARSSMRRSAKSDMVAIGGADGQSDLLASSRSETKSEPCSLQRVLHRPPCCRRLLAAGVSTRRKKVRPDCRDVAPVAASNGDTCASTLRTPSCHYLEIREIRSPLGIGGRRSMSAWPIVRQPRLPRH